MGEGKLPSANGHPSVTALEGGKEQVGSNPGASLPVLKLNSFSVCQRHRANTFSVCLAQSHTPKRRLWV